MKPDPHGESSRTPRENFVNDLALRAADAASRGSEREYEDLFTHLALSYMLPDGVKQACRHVDDHLALAEEAVQEAQRKAHEQLSSGEAPPNFYRWFWVVVRNESFNVLRTEYRLWMKVHPRRVPLDETLHRAGDRDMFDTNKLDIAKAVDSLTPNEQEVVRMRLNDIAVNEIAARLGISRQAVNKRWNRALEKLAVLLRALRDEETDD
jgi:RNA polymerase sigma factor (sigma-70 family)